MPKISATGVASNAAVDEMVEVEEVVRLPKELARALHDALAEHFAEAEATETAEPAEDETIEAAETAEDEDTEHVDERADVRLESDQGPHGLEEVEPVRQAPTTNASKADWVAYAVSRGAVESEAAALTKQELVDKYGAHAE